MRTEKPSYKISVSEEQVMCLETAVQDYEVLRSTQRLAYDRLRVEKERLRTPITGVSITFIELSGILEESINIFSRMAFSLRERGKAEMIAIYDHGAAGTKYLSNVAYLFSDNPQDKIIPVHSGSGYGSVNQAVAGTLFNSMHPNGDAIWPLSSDAYTYNHALMSKGKVILLFDPTVIK